MAGLRIEKVNELLRDHISELLAKEVSLKAGVIATVVKTSVSPDLRRCTIFISAYPVQDAAYVLGTLRQEVYSLQGALNRRLRMRPLPRIRFELDTTEEEAQKVEDILKDLKL